MSVARTRWLEAVQLARAEGGAEALAILHDLSPARQREIHARGQRLAEASLSVAQAYGVRAPRACRDLGPEAFAEWADLGLALAAAKLDNRDAAAAYFRLDPERVMVAPAKLRRRWMALCEDVQRVSRRLAASFLESTGPLLDRMGAGGEERLDAFVTAGLGLAGETGWRGEFLAGALFAAAEEVLLALRAEEIRAWADLGRRVQPDRELSPAFFRRVPAGFVDLGGRERRLVMEICAEGAERDRRIAANLFAELPAALLPLASEIRRSLLEGARHAAADPDSLRHVLPLLGAIVRAVPVGDREAIFRAAARTAKRFPEGFARLLRSLPRALGETRPEGVLAWITRGEELAAEGVDRGLAYFGLESRTSIRELRATSTTARTEEVQGILRSYARMLSAAPLTLRSVDGGSLRAFVDVESLDRSSLALPDHVDLFHSWEENFSLLKLMTANAVGRLLYGTYDLSLPEVVARLPRELGEVLASAVDGEGMEDLLAAVPEADPLIPLFAACEGARIDFRLRSVFRGYDAELRAIAERLRRHSRGRAGTPELILFLLGAGTSPRVLATRELPATVLGEAVAALGSPQSQVEDALAVAILLRERLEDSLAVSGVGAPMSYEELLFEKMAGETMLDPEQGYEGATPVTGASEIVDVEPTAVEEGDDEGQGSPLSAEELRRLLQAGAIVRVGRGEAGEESAGIFASGLPSSALEAGDEDTPGGASSEPLRSRRGTVRDGFEYDEWDFGIGDYRRRWCHLDEVVLAGDAGEFFQQTLARYADLLPEVRRQFQRMRPERYRKVRGLEDGEDFDLNAVVEAHVELRARRTPSSRLYVARRREERDVATLFLLDMSASTDESVAPGGAPHGRRRHGDGPRRIIDITKEALVIMAEALDELGDRYAIYGFSGQGRTNVEFYPVKRFNDGLTPSVRGRIGGIEPRRSTRMGTALRHAITKLANLPARSKHILLLSDGFPQDFDYGNDRRSNTYGIQDTMMALQECQAAGITPFCITVDKTGHDYLREMCESSRYLVLDDVGSLPTELPKIYERWVQG